MSQIDPPSLSAGFALCCGHVPKVTEYRPGCYGVQCMECGIIGGNERQVDRDTLMNEWNSAKRKDTPCPTP